MIRFLSKALLFMTVAPCMAASHGDWSLSRIAAPSGTPVCVLLHSHSADLPVRNIAIKGFANRDFLVVTMYKEAWQLDKGETPVSIAFEDSPAITFAGHADGPVIDMDLRRDLTAEMMISLAKNAALIIRFPSLPEGAWVVPLQEPELSSAFVQCWRQVRAAR